MSHGPALDWRTRHRLATLGLLGLLAGTIFSVTRLTDRFDARRLSRPPERLLYLPEGDSLKFLCLGYDGIAADMIWIRSVMYVGRRLRERDSKYEQLERLYQVTTDLDPHWTQPYKVGATLLSALPQDDERALKLLRRGLGRNPQDWESAFVAAQLDLLRGRNRAAAKWLKLIVATMPGHNKAVEATLMRLEIEGQDYGNAVRVAAGELRTSSSPVVRSVSVGNYREALARLTAAELSEWSSRCRSAGGHAPVDMDALLGTKFRTASDGEVASVRERLSMELAPLIGREEARDFTSGLPADSYGMRFYLRPDGSVGSRGIERMELFRLIVSLNAQMKTARDKLGRPIGSLDEMMAYFDSLYRSGHLTKGVAALLGAPPRLPKHPSGAQAAWSEVRFADGLIQMPPGPTIERMMSAPIAMPTLESAPVK